MPVVVGPVQSPGRGGKGPPPQYPPKMPKIPPPPVEYASAVLAMVDDPSAPKIATVYVNDDLPEQHGYKIPQNLNLTFIEAPNAWSATITYSPGQFVMLNSTYYKCIKTNINNAPPNSDWVIPTGVAYYNNPYTLEGGSWVTVDVSSRTLVSVDQGFSTSPPANPSDLFQYIRHDGAYNTTGNFQDPAPIDSNQLLGNPDPNDAPAFTTSGQPTALTYIGNFDSSGRLNSGTYDAETTFTLTIGAPAWLGELALIAVPVA